MLRIVYVYIILSQRQNHFFPLLSPQRTFFQMSQRVIGPLQSCTPTSLMWGRFMKVRRLF